MTVSEPKENHAEMTSVWAFIIFLGVFLSLYGSMHAYIFLKAHLAFHFSLSQGLVLAAAMAVLGLSMVAGFTLAGREYYAASRPFFYVGYVWLGLMAMAVTAALFIDFYSFFLFIINALAPVDLSFLRPSYKQAFYLIAALSLFINVYGFFEAWNIRTENLTVPTSKLPQGVDRLRIVQISDVHLGVMIGPKRLGRMIDIIKKAEPDILVSTGDLIDDARSDGEELLSRIGKIETKYGKFACTGNHEYYAGIERSVKLTESAGFRLLRGEAVDVAGIITIAGIDDRQSRQFNQPIQSETKVLKPLAKDKFILFLKHMPLFEHDSQGLFDLQLSGHSHKGQIFPFSLVTKLVYPKHSGWLDLDKGSALYTSRGAGFWGPPIRFLAPPEITVIDLVRK